MPSQQTYECFCKKTYSSKMSVYGHLRIKHLMIFHLSDPNAFSLTFSNGYKVFKLEKNFCILQKPEEGNKYTIKQEDEAQNQMIDQSLQKAPKKSTHSNVNQHKTSGLSKTTKQVKPTSLFDFIKEQEQERKQPNSRQRDALKQKTSTVFRIENFSQPKSIKEALDEYVALMKDMNKEHYLDGKIVIFLLMKCTNLNSQKIDSTENKTPLIPYCQNHTPKHITGMFNYFICDFLPQILTKRDTPLSNIIKHNKILKKKQLINFLYGLNRWLNLKNYTKKKITIDEEYRKTFLFE